MFPIGGGNVLVWGFSALPSEGVRRAVVAKTVAHILEYSLVESMRSLRVRFDTAAVSAQPGSNEAPAEPRQSVSP